MDKLRQTVCSKEAFLKVFATAMKNDNVVLFRNGKKSQSREDYWELYRKVKNLEVAIAASAGAQVSLSGIGVLRFAEAGRTEESRSLRFKSKVSSSINKALAEHPEVIYSEAPTSEDEFYARVVDTMALLGTPLSGASPEVVVAGDDVAPSVSDDLI